MRNEYCPRCKKKTEHYVYCIGGLDDEHSECANCLERDEERIIEFE